MRKFLAILLLLPFMTKAQLNLQPGTQKLYTISGRSCLIWTPSDTTVPLHLLVSFVGNSTNDSAAAANQGPAKRIRLTTSGVHRDSFFVVTYIRTAGENGSVSPLSTIDGVLNQIFQHCTFISKTDSTRNFMTGLSQGNNEVMRYLSNWGPVFVGYTPSHRSKFAGEINLSNGSTDGITGGSATTRGSGQYTPTGSRQWYGSTDAVTGTVFPNDLHAFQVAINAYPRSMIDTIVGAGHDNTVWDSAWNVNATTSETNSWLWMLNYSYGLSNTNPNADAGPNQVLALGTTSTTLNGTGSTDPDGTIASYSWSKIQGGSATITSPSASTTTVTGMTNGVYRFRLVVTDDDGATDSDTMTVFIGNARREITKSTANIGQDVGRTPIVPLWQLWDGDTTTTICPPPGFHTVGVDIPTNSITWLDSTYYNFAFQVFNNATTSVTPARIILYAERKTDSMVINFTPTANAWQYIDSANTKGVWFPVRYVKFVSNACFQGLAEIKIYGTAVAAGQQIFPSYRPTPITTYDEFQGATTNGDEPVDRLQGAVGSTRQFNNYWYSDSQTTYNTTRNFMYTVYGSPITPLTNLKNAGIKVRLTKFQASRWAYSPTPTPADNYGAYGDNKKQIVPGSDSSLPASWQPAAVSTFIDAAIFGRNAAASFGPHTVTLSGGSVPSKGQDLAVTIETDNEDNFYNIERQQSATAKAAKMSAIFDGHKGTLGATSGIRTADTTMEVSSGAMVGSDSFFIKRILLESYFLRGLDSIPFNDFTINQYFVYGGAQAFFSPSDNGISPGQFNWWPLAQKLVLLRDRYMPGVKLSFGEIGWDKNQNTAYSALAHGTLDEFEVQANWMTQAFIVGRAAGISRIYQYRSRDEGALNNNSDFATSGQFSGFNANPDSNYIRWDLNYWMQTTMKMLQRYDSELPTMINWGDSTGLTHVKFDSVTSVTDTLTRVLWMGTNDDSDTTVTLTLEGNIAWVERVDMAKLDNDGVHTTLTPTGNQVTVSNVGETPVFVRYVLSSAALPRISNSRFRFRN